MNDEEVAKYLNAIVTFLQRQCRSLQYYDMLKAFEETGLLAALKGLKQGE